MIHGLDLFTVRITQTLGTLVSVGIIGASFDKKQVLLSHLSQPCLINAPPEPHHRGNWVPFMPTLILF